jgi:hypothetical protein
MPKLRKGVYYFESFQAARSHAESNGLPTDRIIPYQIGWAIQLKVSGPYAGIESEDGEIRIAG